MAEEDVVLPSTAAFDPQTSISSPKPFGFLLPLKTVEELKASGELIDVYITKVRSRAASPILSRLRPIIESSDVDLHHLRRFASLKNLPEQVRVSLICRLHGPKPCISEERSNALFFLIAPVKTITFSALTSLLSDSSSCKRGHLPVVHVISVPLLPPTSQSQADSWTLSHWPTIFKKSNPFGPHPSIVLRAEDEIVQDVDLWMSMAEQVASQAYDLGYGEPIGAVIVDRAGGTSRAIALAGDGRWKESQHGLEGIGNVMAHAAMRAIAMVALKVKRNDERAGCLDTASTRAYEDKTFLDNPLTHDEKVVFMGEAMSPGGYLCHNLEIYLTHEPCIMCSMAILHSRFGRVVFGRRMPTTGGLCGESTLIPTAGLGYGLFWRRELNWSLLAWQYAPVEIQDRAGMSNTEIHA